MLNLAPRALWRVAEQLLGRGTVVWPAGLDESGYTTGPCFMCDDAVGRTKLPCGALDGLAIKGRLHDRACATVAQNRTGVAQWAGDSWIILYPAE